MQKPSFVLLFTLLFGGLWSAGAQESSGDIALTVYNHGAALIRDQRRLTLDEGLNVIRISDIAAAIDPTSVSFQSLSDPGGTFALEQHYIYDLADTATLLSRYLNETIHITAADGAVYRGELLGERDGEVILRMNGGAIAVINRHNARDIRLPAQPDAVTVRPTLQWLLSSSAAGLQDVELAYLAGGINWSADYNILLEADASSLDIKSWITLENRSGRGFSDARLKLVAGDINRIQPKPMLAESRALAFDADGIGGGGGLEPRELSEYQLYEVARAVTIGSSETKQIEFVSDADIAASSFFVFDGSPPVDAYYSPIDYPGDYGGSNQGAVLTFLEFNTAADLPAGRVRVYQPDADGAGLLIGEDLIDHTAGGEDVRILLGTAFDLTGERTQTDFKTVARDVIQETIEIRLRSRKDSETVTIRVPERLYRWSDWEIIASSAPYTRQNGSTIEFRLELAPEDEQVLMYTVQYRLPPNR